MAHLHRFRNTKGGGPLEDIQVTILASPVTNVPVVPLLGYGDYKDKVLTYPTPGDVAGWGYYCNVYLQDQSICQMSNTAFDTIDLNKAKADADKAVADKAAADKAESEKAAADKVAADAKVREAGDRLKE